LWEAFLNTGRLRGEKAGLGEVASVLAGFLMPPAQAVFSGKPFGLTWRPSGPWC